MRGLTRRPLATTRRNARARTFGRYSRLCPLRRSLPSQRIATGQTRDAHAECAKRPNASQPRRRSGTHFAAVHTNGFAAERRPHTCRIPTAIRCRHEESQIVNPMIPDLAAAARWLAAARRTHSHIYRSDRTPVPVCACAARREGPSHADRDIEMALRCRPRTPATPQLGGEAAPIQIIA